MSLAMHALAPTLITTGIASAIFLIMSFWVLQKPQALKRKLKQSTATSSIIMRRFLVNDAENDPFVGFSKQFNTHDEALVDIGAWAGGE